MLDTGHLLNSDPTVADEQSAVALVLKRIAQLSPQVRTRIEGVHLNLSLSGDYQRQAQAAGIPARFAEHPFDEQFAIARDHVAEIDQHRPFTSPCCQEIIAALRPRVVTHELLMRSRDELERHLLTQYRALNGGC
ncbi:hypothetical protein [Candidatus Viridilinea mediisalina]|uniref:Xylose isomerase-like TIM barrel domain-containing protein n=1 Tax=Candidatus Viridilinea mediisalina TaxID=2024553 RepID=A0A2A6RDX6_9CHLR|nr:hypothetical protein [Candidatus Viridilinea mediisalina]PDW00784.1 hypothetical protein CJ255_20280 [Candidatus Viridilinea mediisalina]